MIYFQHSDMSNESPIEQNEPEMQGDCAEFTFQASNDCKYDEFEEKPQSMQQEH